MIAQAINDYVSNPANPAYIVQQGPVGKIYVYWPVNENFGAFGYADALIVRFTVQNDFWPKIAFIRGFPVLSLRDLIREYDRNAALVGEFRRTQILKSTSAHLRDLLTRFDH